MNNQDLMDKSNPSHPNRVHSRAPSEPVLASYYPPHTGREVSVPNDTPSLDVRENIGIGGTNTIDIYLCVEDEDKKENESPNDDQSEHSIESEVTQRHNKYMFTNKSRQEFYVAPYNKTQDTNWHIFEYNNIFLTETSFLSDIFSNVMQPLIHSFKNGSSGCLALYSPDKTAWNDRLQLFDIVHQILLQLNIAQSKCRVSAYEVNDDDAYDLLPIKARHSATSSNILQFSRSKKNRAPLKLSLNRCLHYVFQNINKIGIKSIEMGLQYFERSHNLFASSKSSHYVYSITTEDGHELRIVQLCTADPMRNQALLNMRQCIKVLKRNKHTHSHTNVPYRRHIFTKLFQEFIDGTSAFSFLFYLPPIHTHKAQTTLYLDRILSLLKYSCKAQRVSQAMPLSHTPSAFTSNVITPQNETQQNQSMLHESLLQSAESTNINMKTLLNRAYDELELSRQQTEKLLSHKNETIQQLSKQVDSVRSECVKETQGLRDEVKTLKEDKQKGEHKAKQYRKQVHVLHNEIKVMNKSTAQIKDFLSQVTKLLQIDLDKTQSLSWKDILIKVSEQKAQLDGAKEKIVSLESTLHDKDASCDTDTKQHTEQMTQSQQMIENQKKEIEALKKQIKTQSTEQELLSKQMEEMNKTHDIKVDDMSKNHDKELKELHVVLDQLSDEFTSLKSSQQSSPKKKTQNKECIDSLKSQIVHLEFQSVVHQQLTYKVQQIHDKLQRKFATQKDQYKAEIDAKEDIQQKYDTIHALHQQTCQSLTESHAKCEALKHENDTLNQTLSELHAAKSLKEEELEATTSSYKALLNEISPLQDEHRKLQKEYEFVSKAYQEAQTKINNYKQTQKQLMTHQMLAKFQSAVHRELNASLKKQIKSQSKLKVTEYKKSIRKKDEIYDKLHGEYQDLQREFDEHLRSGNMVKSLEADKENLEVVNKRLQQQTSVYRFQSAAHQKIAQSAKYQKNKLKSQVIELLEQHAPNEQIKGILKDSTATYHQKIHAAPLQTNALPSFDEIETPKAMQKIDSELLDENAHLKERMQQLQERIKSLKRDKKHQKKMQQMTLKQERNKWLYKVADLKKELCAIMQAVQSSTKYVYQESKCEIRKVLQDYDGKHQVLLVQIENDNSKLKVEVQKLQLTNETCEQQLRDTKHQLDALRNDLQYKDAIIEQFKDEIMDNEARIEHKELRRKHDMMMNQCLSMSKVNEAMQRENNKLVDDSIANHDKYQSLQHQHRSLSHSLFKRILISSCYQYKCKQLHQDRDNAQTDLTVEQLKMLQLNDEVQELKQMNDVFQSNRTGLMLETMEAKDTIHELLQENNVLKTTILSKQIKQMKQMKRKRTQTDIPYCNDPIHEHTIATLTRKFSRMCQKMDKVQMESLDYVQKAVALRDDNIKLKKENRRHRREIRYLESELDEARSKSIEPRDTVSVEAIRTQMNPYCVQMNDAQMNAIQSTERCMHQMNERLNVCVNRIKGLKRTQTAPSFGQKARDIEAIMMQMSDVSDHIINGMAQRFDERCTLFDMRCDGASRNIQLIKHALDTRQNEDKQLQLEERQKMEKHFYDLQFVAKVTVTTFKKEMMVNIRHVMQCYKEEYDETQTTVAKTFALAIQRFNRSLEEKNSQIDELKGIVSAKTDEFDRLMDKKMNYNELKGIHDGLKTQITQLHAQMDAQKEVESKHNQLQQKVAQQNELINKLKQMQCEFEQKESKYNEERSVNDKLQNKMIELQDTIVALTDEVNTVKQMTAENEAMKEEMKRLMKVKEEHEEAKKTIESLENKIQQNNTETTQLQAVIEEQLEQMNDVNETHEKQLKELQNKDKMNQETQQQLKSENEEQKEAINRMQCNNDALQSQLWQQKQRIEALSTEKGETIERLQTEMAQYEETMKGIRSKYDAMQCTNDGLQNELSQQKQKITHKEKIHQQMKTVNEAQKEAMEKIQKEVCQYKQRIQEISIRKEKINEEIVKYEALKTVSEAKYDAIHCENDGLQSQLCQHKQIITEISTQKEKMRQQMKTLETAVVQYEELKIVNKQQKDAMEEMRSKYDEIQRAKDGLQSEVCQCKQEIQEMHQQMLQLKAKTHEDETTKQTEMTIKIQDLSNELRKTKKQRNAYYSDKKVLQKEMQLVSKELDELNESKTHLMTQLKQLMEFHCNTSQLKEKMKEYSQMTARNQQRIEQLELMKNALEKDNRMQLTENASLKQQMAVCDAQITKLKHCIVTKFEALDDKYDAKVDRIHALEDELALKQQMIDELKANKQNHDALLCKYVLTRDEMKVCADRIHELEYRVSVKKQRMQCVEDKHSAEKNAIECKLQRLTIVIVNKLNSVTHLLRSKDVQLNELSSLLTVRNEEFQRMIHRKLEYEDENEMLNEYKLKLEAEVNELNRNLNALHSKHRVMKQSLDKSNKMNQKMKEAQDESFDLQKQLALSKHETEQIHRHRDHIKEKCDELESRLARYKDRFRSTVKESVVLRKQSTVLQQLIRCAGNEIGELEFDKKAGNVREKMLTDLIASDDDLHKLHQIFSSEEEEEEEEEECDNSFLLQRIDDLKSECNHYRHLLRMNDEIHIDLKQETAVSTHQILENWQKIFDKLMSMMNIKSYTIEIMQKTVSDVVSATDGDLARENVMLTHHVAEMKQDVRKLEAKHRKEKIELQGLLDREVALAHSQRDCMERELNVYRAQLQTFYKKYHRSTEHLEHEKLASFMDNMRHEMTQISQENVTMATVTNSLREIVREHQDREHKLETQNETMFDDIRGLCQSVQQISGETILSEDEEGMYSANNLSQMVSVVKQRALSISSSRSSLQQSHDDDENEYAIIDHSPKKRKHKKKKKKKKKEEKVNECPICEQEFNAMVWKYKCCGCDKHHCSLCAPIRQYYQQKNKSKCRVCHACYQPQHPLNDTELP